MPSSVTFWNRLAARYDAQSARYMERAYPLTIEAAKRATSSTDTVLDIGCGTGIVTLGVAPAAEQVLGVDIAGEMIEIAEGKAKARDVENVTFRTTTTDSLPDGAFDVVLICNVLLYVPQPTALLQEAHRLLVDDGVLVTVTDCLREPAGAGVLLQRWGVRLLTAVRALPQMHLFRKRDLVAMTEAAGFRIEEDGIFYPAPVNYYLRARRTV